MEGVGGGGGGGGGGVRDLWERVKCLMKMIDIGQKNTHQVLKIRTLYP